MTGRNRKGVVAIVSVQRDVRNAGGDQRRSSIDRDVSIGGNHQRVVGVRAVGRQGGSRYSNLFCSGDTGKGNQLTVGQNPARIRSYTRHEFVIRRSSNRQGRCRACVQQRTVVNNLFAGSAQRDWHQVGRCAGGTSDHTGARIN